MGQVKLQQDLLEADSPYSGHSATALISAPEPRKVEQAEEEKSYAQVEDEKKMNPPGPRLSFATLVKSMTSMKSSRARKGSTTLKSQLKPVLDEDERLSEDNSDQCNGHFLKLEEKSEEEIWSLSNSMSFIEVNIKKKVRVS